jgi:endonuclease/exonuclease/phosphatase family metal-dependent hydrolase
MRFITFLSAILFTSALIAHEQLILPLTPEEVDQYIEKAGQNIRQNIDQLIALPESQRTPQTVMRSWSRFGNELLASLGMLSYLSEEDFPSKTRATQAIPELIWVLFQSMIQNPTPFNALMGYAKTILQDNRTAGPYECYEIQCLVDSCENIKNGLSQREQAILEEIKALNSQRPKQSFIHLRGNVEPKTSSQETLKESGLTIFNLNICFAPGELAYIHGGVAPWQERVTPLADKILLVDADVVCLEEMHPVDANYALYEKLKDTYAYFYLAIGPRPLGFSIHTLGLPSGLFVASKYPIEEPHFTLFSVTGLQMNYGFFDCIIKNANTPIAHLYTTHLQSLSYEKFDHIRALQLEQILEKIRSDISKQKEIPYFLCGDLNIPYGSKEPSETLIQTHFYNSYNAKHPGEVIPANSTCTNYFSNVFLSKIKPNQEPLFEILDYALLFNQPTGYTIDTIRIQANDLDHPESALSDHHGLFTIIHHN